MPLIDAQCLSTLTNSFITLKWWLLLLRFCSLGVWVQIITSMTAEMQLIGRSEVSYTCRICLSSVFCFFILLFYLPSWCILFTAIQSVYNNNNNNNENCIFLLFSLRIQGKMLPPKLPNHYSETSGWRDNRYRMMCCLFNVHIGCLIYLTQ